MILPLCNNYCYYYDYYQFNSYLDENDLSLNFIEQGYYFTR